MSIFEMVMLICFGVAWPSSIYKSYVSRTSRGKSLFFLLIVMAGYVSGILHKVFYSLDWVILLYLVNGCMILVDIMLHMRNSALDRRRELSGSL